MAPAEEHYRRLPGRRRGLITGASVWMGSDHILLVKSAWFREEYKRFYLRDIQAIVMAPEPRFYFSLPMLVLAMAWPIPAFFLEQWPRPVTIGWIAATVALAAAWLAVSLAGGCRCRLYTAVSRDELPSLFRTWTARRFLRQLEPRIAEVQGALDPSWAGSEAAAPAAAEAASPALSTAGPRPAPAGHTPVSDLFVLVLAGSAITGLVTAHSRSLGWERANTALALLVIVTAVAVLVQYSRGALQRGLQRVAVAAMLLSGVTFYVQSFTFIYARGSTLTPPLSSAAAMPAAAVVTHQVTYAMQLLLSLAGAILTLRATYRDEPDIIKD